MDTKLIRLRTCAPAYPQRACACAQHMHMHMHMHTNTNTTVHAGTFALRMRTRAAKAHTCIKGCTCITTFPHACKQASTQARTQAFMHVCVHARCMGMRVVFTQWCMRVCVRVHGNAFTSECMQLHATACNCLQLHATACACNLIRVRESDFMRAHAHAYAQLHEYGYLCARERICTHIYMNARTVLCI